MAVFTFGISLILLLLIGFLTATLLEKDISEARSSANTFNKNFPFRYFGQVFGSFQHVFYNAYSIEKDIYAAIEKELKAKTPITSLDVLSISDKDKDLEKKLKNKEKEERKRQKEAVKAKKKKQKEQARAQRRRERERRRNS